MTSASRQLRSTLGADGQLERSLASVEVPDAGPDQVILQLGSAPAAHG